LLGYSRVLCFSPLLLERIERVKPETIDKAVSILPETAAVVLAAGKGTRMRSALPKILQPMLNEPMLLHLLRALHQTGIAPERTVIVVGYGADKVKQAVSAFGNYLFAEQTAQLGTGHALKSALPALAGLPAKPKHLLALLGDGPLLRPETLLPLFAEHTRLNPLITMLTTVMADPFGYGRIVRDAKGNFQAIIEEVELAPEQKLIQEINPSLYLFQTDWVSAVIDDLKPSAVKGEYYLTDLPGMAIAQNPAGVATVPATAEDVLGINDRVQLAEATLILRRRILHHWMLAGVTILDPATAYISAEVTIGTDTIIEPNCHLRGTTKIGNNCLIGANSLIESSIIGDNCKILASVIEHSTFENEVQVGPFSHVRPKSYLEQGVYIGNFAEVNRSHLGANTKQSHFSYMGDATVGENTNIAAGTITANFDGVDKHKTTVGKNVKLGVDTMLVAPVSVGDGATTGAGAVVTKDVAPDTTVIGVPAKPLPKKEGEQDKEVRREA
jgi:bifunctional UDP-N-acetylglucosamine pyrophosphorylase / glucosamine-1-phosphate N-acetyltransferase